MTIECQECTEVANENYTLHTGQVTVCLRGEAAARDLGNIKEITFTYTPEFVDHFAGATSQLDAKMPLRSRFVLAGVLDELTPGNLAVVLGETQLPNTPSGCIIPLRAPNAAGCDAKIAAVEFVHTFPCGTKTITFRFWRAVIGAESALTFGEDILEIPVTFEALGCASTHPDAPYGEIEFSEECTLS